MVPGLRRATVLRLGRGRSPEPLAPSQTKHRRFFLIGEAEPPSRVAFLDVVPDGLDREHAVAVLATPQPPALKRLSECLFEVVYSQAGTVDHVRHSSVLRGR